jgi:hypothetical protein
MRLEAVPVKYRALYAKALEGKVGRRDAIKLKCLDCCGWRRMDDGKDQIRDCVVRGCPLWSVRPFQMARESSHAAETGALAKVLEG